MGQPRAGTTEQLWLVPLGSRWPPDTRATKASVAIAFGQRWLVPRGNRGRCHHEAVATATVELVL